MESCCFSGYAIDSAGQDLLRELVGEQPRTNEKNPFIAAATCQLRYNITGHQLSPQTDAEGVVNVELTMVPIRELHRRNSRLGNRQHYVQQERT